MKKIAVITMILVIIAGFAGAGVSIAMLIRAVQWSEWGRVIVYGVTLTVCVELAVILIGKLKENIGKA